MTATPHAAAASPAARRRAAAGTLLSAARPRQWLKNLLLFAGLLFAAKLPEEARWLEATAAFAAFCLVASAAYLLNDVRDADDDRRHPVKRLRPVAAGDLSPRSALMVAFALAAAGVALAASLGPRTLVYLLAFASLQAAYTLRLKRRAFVDVTVIAALFVIRAAAGAAAVHVRISPWLLVCTASLALFLGLAKRRGELLLAERGGTRGRAALAAYSRPTLDRLLWLTAAAAVAAYSAYGLAGPEASEMALTIPFVVAGIGRYLRLVHRHDLGEAPEYLLLSDKLLLSSVALWVIATSVVLGGG
jgi:4-hydroxybenzoate polyprenyltransferase